LDIARLRQEARRFEDARFIVVFGSMVHGQARPWSDLDIGVAGVSLLRGGEIGDALGKAVGREPHVVDLDAASDHLRFEVARSGVLLGEAEPGAWARFQAEAALRWFDLAPIVELCRQGVARRLMKEARG
jgi:predicted nucleotidyltransferase